jgi:hypothetical protein
MDALPVAMPVTTPVDEPTVAIPVLLLLQVPPAEPSDKVVAVLVHMLVVPEIGSMAFTVTTAVIWQPVLPAIYVITVVPPATAVTTPLAEATVATAVALLLHVPDPEASLRVKVLPAQTAALPLIAAGKLLTVTTVVAIQPEVIL